MLPLEEAYAALRSIHRIKRVYERHHAAAGNIEFRIEQELGRTIFSVKGTSANPGSGGWYALVRDVVTDMRVLPRKSRIFGTWHPAGFMFAGERLAERIRQ